MADVKFTPVLAVLPSGSSGSVDVTVPGFGTPKGVIVVTNNNNALNSDYTTARLSVGFSDGTRQFVSSMTMGNGGSTTSANRSNRDDRLALMLNISTPTELKGYQFDQWITDGVRISHAAGNTSFDRQSLVILIGGADVADVYVSPLDDIGSGTAPVDITAPGFEPSLVFLTSVLFSGALQSEVTQALLSFGCAINDGSDTQAVLAVGSSNGDAISENAGYLGFSAALAQVFRTTLAYEGVVGDFDANGFSITPTSDGGNDVLGYMAIRFTGDPDIALVQADFPVAGDLDLNTIGFSPDSALVVALDAPTSPGTLASSNTWGIAFAGVDASAVTSIGVSSEDAQSIQDTGSRVSNSFFLLDDAGNTSVEASAVAFDADGINFTLSTNPAVVNSAWVLAIGSGTVAGTVVEAAMSATLSLGATATADAAGQSVVSADLVVDTGHAAQADSNAAIIAGPLLGTDFIPALVVNATITAATGVSVGSAAVADAGAGTPFGIGLGDTMTSVVDAGGAVEAQLTFGLALSGQATAQAQAVAELVTAMGLGDTYTGVVDAGGAIPAEITAEVQTGAQATAQADAQAAINVTTRTESQVRADAIAASALIVDLGMGAQVSAGSDFTAQFTSAVGLLTSAEAGVGIDASIDISAGLGTSLDAQAEAHAAAHMDMELASDVLSSALAQAGVTVAQLISLTFAGAEVSAQYVTPAGRTYIVRASTRVYTVAAVDGGASDARVYVVEGFENAGTGSEE